MLILSLKYANSRFFGQIDCFEHFVTFSPKKRNGFLKIRPVLVVEFVE